jgi:hypothetical protein
VYESDTTEDVRFECNSFLKGKFMADRIVNVKTASGAVSLTVSVVGLVRAIAQAFLYDASDQNPVEIPGQQDAGTQGFTFNLGQPATLAGRVVTWLITAAPAGNDTAHCIMIATFQQNGQPCPPSPFSAPPDDISDVTVLALSARVQVQP